MTPVSSRSRPADGPGAVPAVPLAAALLLAAAAAAPPAAGQDAPSGDAARADAAGPAAEAAPADLSALRFEDAHAALAGVRPDGDGAVTVEGLALRREAAALTFREGAALPLRTATGRVVGAVFTGAGRFDMRPPTRVEREQLARFYDTDSLSIELEGAVLFFTDDTWSAVADAGSPATVMAAGDARDGLEEALDYLHEEDDTELDPDLLRAYLNGVGGFLHAHLVPRDGDRLYYRVEPDALEEVTFGREAGGDEYEVVNRFHRLADYGPDGSPTPAAVAADRGRDTMAVSHYEIDAAFESGLDFSARATLTLEGTRPPGSWIRLALDGDIRVDSVRWSSGTAAEHARPEESWSLWVRLPEAGDGARRLTVWYRGDDVVDYRRGWYYPSTPSHWYPRLGRSVSTFDLTFRHPDDRDLVAVGRKTSERREEDVVVSRWQTDFPAIHASFNLGDYEQYRLTDPRVPPVTLQLNAEFHRDLATREIRPDQRIISLDPDEVEQRIGGDLMNAISYFTTWFGPPPMDELYAAEIPSAHGQAFPGMIHLSWISFQIVRRSDMPGELRAHEVAHQWWGLGVETETYHDVWLGEGLATFASLFYRQVMLGEGEAYFDRLDEYRDDILDRRGKAGPIWLGPRLYTRDTEEDYRLIVYRKGAWVFHMLRNLFLDLRGMDESNFRLVLADLYERYRGDRLSTEEFEAHLERLGGIEMDWFFDQWVYGTAIPKYRVSYAKEEREDGTHRLRVRVEQERVPDDFRMSVPAEALLANGDRVRFRMMVEGPVTEMELPPLSAEPEEVTFNLLDSVLAEVDDDGWVD